MAPPFRTAEFDIMYEEGISKSGDVLDIAVNSDVVEKRGSYYSFGEIRLGQGRENVKGFLKENPQVLDEIEARVREELHLPPKMIPPRQEAESED